MVAKKRFKGFTDMSQKRYPRIMSEVLDLVADRLYQEQLLQIAVVDPEGGLVEVWDCRLLGTDEIQALCFPVQTPRAEEYHGCTIEMTAGEVAEEEPIAETNSKPDWYLNLLSEVGQDLALPPLDFSLFVTKLPIDQQDSEADQVLTVTVAAEVSLTRSPNIDPCETSAVVAAVDEPDSSKESSLESFRQEIFQAWKSLAMSQTPDYWGVPVTLEAIYQEGFSRMFARCFLVYLLQLEEAGAGDYRILLIDSDGRGCDIGGGRRVETLTFIPVGLPLVSEALDEVVQTTPVASPSPPTAVPHPLPPTPKIRSSSRTGAIATGLHSLQTWLLPPKAQSRKASGSSR